MDFIIYLGILAIIAWVGLKEYRRSREGPLLLILLIFITGAAFGAPVITNSRFSSVFWIFLFFIFKIIEARGKGANQIENHSV